jgi:hypothetical protein
LPGKAPLPWNKVAKSPSYENNGQYLSGRSLTGRLTVPAPALAAAAALINGPTVTLGSAPFPVGMATTRAVSCPRKQS